MILRTPRSRPRSRAPYINRTACCDDIKLKASWYLFSHEPSIKKSAIGDHLGSVLATEEPHRCQHTLKGWAGLCRLCAVSPVDCMIGPVYTRHIEEYSSLSARCRDNNKKTPTRFHQLFSSEQRSCSYDVHGIDERDIWYNT